MQLLSSKYFELSENKPNLYVNLNEIIIKYCINNISENTLVRIFYLDPLKMNDNSKSISFYFESNGNGGYVGVFADSQLIQGEIVTQNAGSSNYGIYYQVGGGGLNGVFESKLTPTGKLDQINNELIKKYEEKYGKGSYSRDSTTGVQNKLTSFLIPVPHGQSGIGDKVVGMIYSVGPVLGHEGIIKRSTYSQIYSDAVQEIISANQSDGSKIVGMRITMLSTGIYAQLVDSEKDLYKNAAELTIRGILSGYQASGATSSFKVLINTNRNKQDSVTQEKIDKELNGFTDAVNGISDLNITMDPKGFTVEVPD